PRLGRRRSVDRRAAAANAALLVRPRTGRARVVRRGAGRGARAARRARAGDGPDRARGAGPRGRGGRAPRRARVSVPLHVSREAGPGERGRAFGRANAEADAVAGGRYGVLVRADAGLRVEAGSELSI